MPPTEEQILTDYLLQPAPLNSILTFDQFKSLFPRQVQGSQHLRTLFRDLQSQRNALIDTVTASIDDETQRGQVMRRQVLQQLREADREEVDGEIELERALFAEDSGAKKSEHSLDTILPELEGASAAIQAEIQRLRQEEAAITESIKQTVERLGDLRYGKMADPSLKDDVLDGLASLQETCESKT